IDQPVSKLDLADLIEWVGFTEDVASELRKLDIFVLPSTHGEGLPIATLEAMSVGLPVVTTNIPGNDEVIRDGLDGYLCKPEDGQSLADNLEKIMSQPDNWTKLSASAYQRQQESFSDESMTSAIASVYDNILSGR
ncbi:MAG: glycosyltransferase, partial [Gammaproteobacteria bacterium]|nr:glycosyltransferase [Gammaproteobacteria bacterium]